MHEAHHGQGLAGLQVVPADGVGVLLQRGQRVLEPDIDQIGAVGGSPLEEVSAVDDCKDRVLQGQLEVAAGLPDPRLADGVCRLQRAHRDSLGRDGLSGFFWHLGLVQAVSLGRKAGALGGLNAGHGLVFVDLAFQPLAEHGGELRRDVVFERVDADLVALPGFNLVGVCRAPHVGDIDAGLGAVSSLEKVVSRPVADADIPVTAAIIKPERDRPDTVAFAGERLHHVGKGGRRCRRGGRRRRHCRHCRHCWPLPGRLPRLLLVRHQLIDLGRGEPHLAGERDVGGGLEHRGVLALLLGVDAGGHELLVEGLLDLGGAFDEHLVGLALLVHDLRGLGNHLLLLALELLGLGLAHGLLAHADMGHHGVAEVGAGDGCGVLGGRDDDVTGHVPTRQDGSGELLAQTRQHGIEFAVGQVALVQHLDHLLGVDVEVLDRRAFSLGGDVLLIGRRIALAQLAGGCRLSQALEVVGHQRCPPSVGARPVDVIEDGFRALDQRRLAACGDDGGDESLGRSVLPFRHVGRERLVGVQHRPFVQILNNGGHLLPRDFRSDLPANRLQQAGVTAQVLEELDKRHFLGSIFHRSLSAAVDRGAERIEPLLSRLPVLVAAHCAYVQSEVGCCARRAAKQ